jgi:hypothetical protein
MKGALIPRNPVIREHLNTPEYIRRQELPYIWFGKKITEE